jgi:hypothetical protein
LVSRGNASELRIHDVDLAGAQQRGSVGITIIQAPESVVIEDFQVRGFETGLQMVGDGCAACSLRVANGTLVGVGGGTCLQAIPGPGHPMSRDISIERLSVAGCAIGVQARTNGPLHLEDVHVMADDAGLSLRGHPVNAAHINVINAAGIALSVNVETAARLDDVVVQNASVGVEVHGGNLMATHLRVAGSGLAVWLTGAGAQVSDSVFTDNGRAGAPGIPSGAVETDSALLVTGTVFERNTPVGLHSSGPSADARGNYWGDASGPRAWLGDLGVQQAVGLGAGDAVDYDTQYLPYLTTPP